MGLIDVSIINENDMIKFITPNKTLFEGKVKKVSENCLGLTIDVRQENFVRLSKDQQVKLILVHARQAIKCASIVIGTSQSDFEQAVLITIPKFILAIDRREFERLPIVIDIEYSILPSETSYLKLNNVESRYLRAFRKTYTVDISAGGVYFIVPKNEIDTKFAVVSLSLRNEKIMALCEKVRLDYTNDSRHNRIAFKYNDIKTQHRQLILDFVSEKIKDNKGD